MKVGVNGAVRDISDLKVGVNGAVRAVSEAYVGVSGAVKKVWPNIPVGYQEILDTVGEGVWECPATGEWEVEGHGAGGHGSRALSGTTGGAGGGGSGEVETLSLIAGQIIEYTIAASNTSSSQGGSTVFQNLTFYGGYSPSNATSTGKAWGSIASDGSIGGRFSTGAGGKGNVNAPEQTYGNGGGGGSYTRPTASGKPGEPGAIILTYLG